MRSFFDALFGRTRPEPPKVDRLFAIGTAEVSLEAQLRLTPAQDAGISFRPVESAYFEQMTTDLNQLLAISAKDTGTQVKTLTDEYGFRWVVLNDDAFEDLVATIHITSETLIDQQFGEQLLAAVFRFNTPENRPVYWIYNYKRGSFYPFVPEQGTRKRDNAYELRLSSAMEKELPIEAELERWYPIWDIPF